MYRSITATAAFELSPTAVECVAALATGLGPSFDPLVSISIPTFLFICSCPSSIHLPCQGNHRNNHTPDLNGHFDNAMTLDSLPSILSTGNIPSSIVTGVHQQLDSGILGGFPNFVLF